MDELTGCCDQCTGTFPYRLIHNGFNDSSYAYCGRCSFTVLLSGWSRPAQRARLGIHQRITPGVEMLLRPCPCGAAFLAPEDPKCPECARPLSSAKAAMYIERDAPGTARGWRWQRSWSGIYSIVLNGKLVQEWWDEQAIDRLFPTED